MITEYSKELMKLTPFQVITDTIRQKYAYAVMYELREAYSSAKKNGVLDTERLTFKITHRGNLHYDIAQALSICYGDKSVFVEEQQNHTVFTINVKMAYEYREAENAKLEKETL